MEQMINLPVTYKDKEGNTITQTVSTNLVDLDKEESKYISSMKYVPYFQQDKPVFQDAVKLLDVLVNNENLDDDTLKEINQAFCDTLYKYPGYSRLSYGAKVTLLQEKGFGYVLDLLLHMYDNEYKKLEKQYEEGEISEIPLYDDFVKSKADVVLTKITSLFNLINALKGKTLGLELVLGLIGLPSYIYLPWNIVANYKGEWEGAIEDLPLPNSENPPKAGDCYSKTVGTTVNYFIFNGAAWHQCGEPSNYEQKREPLTAILEVFDSTMPDLQKKLTTFVRYYMLPLIDVTIKLNAEFPTVYAFPSGVYELYKYFEMSDYVDDEGTHIQKNLVHELSDECWHYSDMFTRRQLNFGIPATNSAFLGTVDLKKSYVKDKNGNIVSLFSNEPHLAEGISGTAVSKVDADGKITNYDGDYLQMALENYVDIDILTGNQQNPHYEGDVFERDTVIQFFQNITVGGIHLNKTCQQLEEILIGDFEKDYGYAEVYLGKSTDLLCESGKNHDEDKFAVIDQLKIQYTPYLLGQGISQTTIDEYVSLYKIIHSDAPFFERYESEKTFNSLTVQYPDLTLLTTFPQFYEFTYSDVEIREQTGVENFHLIFCDEELDGNYTGIGDLGILGANDYFIYNGMLIYHGDILTQVGDSKKWTDIGASHAISETYYTPGINNGELYSLHLGEIDRIHRSPNLDAYVSYIIKHPQILIEKLHLNMSIEELDEEMVRSFVESWYELDEYWDIVEHHNWTAVTGYVNDFYTAFAICDGRLYKIFKLDDEIYYEIMDDEQGWTDVTGAAYSETYEAYGIKNSKLFRISADKITEIYKPDAIRVTGVENVTYEDNTFTYYALTKNDTLKLEFIEEEKTEDEFTWTENVLHITFNGTEQDYEVEYTDKVIYQSENIKAIYNGENLERVDIKTSEYECTITMNGEPATFVLQETAELVGWGNNYDCISRYHHCNSDYTTYGICAGVLYAITNEEIKKLDETKTWTAVCGFYNDNSPRTFAYAIAGGKLYELQGENIVLKEGTKYWTEIHGCTTATNNFVIGLAKTNANAATGSIYKINAKDNTPALMDNRNDWTSIFGRYSTSTAQSNICYGYGIRDNRLYQFTKDGISIISGFWKVDGTGAIAKLSDYNITSIKTNLPDGTVLTTEDEIKEVAPVAGTVLSDYDIYATYTTKGFDNNERYNIRTEISAENYIYFHPEECRTGVSEEHCRDLFGIYTGLMTGFISRNFTINGSDIVDGNGIARRFAENSTYITLPDVDATEFIADFEYSCNDTALHPVILAEDETGIYYGYNNNKYGLFLKYSNGTMNILETQQGQEIESTIKYVFNGNYSNIYIKTNGFVKKFESTSSSYVSKPVYLGGNGTDFGDMTFYLGKCYYTTSDGQYYLFENGRYFSVNTQNQDLIEVIKTDATQATQKVIEVKKADNEIIELSMDELYCQMIPSVKVGNLSVETDFNVNVLRQDAYEGETYATLTFEGAYELDPEKITSNISLDNVCDFKNTGVAEHLNEWNIISFNLSTDITTPIKIKSGNVVENQMLYQTEEGVAYTNKYLLQSDISAVSDVQVRTAPSGIIYELNTDEPKTVTKTLTYNGEAFTIDSSKISDYAPYWFNEYEAMLHYYPQYEYDEEGVSQYVEAYSKIVLPEHYKFKIKSTELNQQFMKIDEEEFLTSGVGDYYYSIDYTRGYTHINDRVQLVQTATEEKDKLQYSEGKYWNYNDLAYHKITNLSGITSLTLAIKTDDDASKDQTIFGTDNHGFGIKDNMFTFTTSGLAVKSSYIVDDNSNYYISFRKVGNYALTTKADIYVSTDNENWTLLFSEAKMSTSMMIGRGNTAGDILSFNGTIDLARSYLSNKERLFLMNQTTTVKISSTDSSYTTIRTINTDYAIDEIFIGYHFNGELDMYYSQLLNSYDLEWVENRMNMDRAVKSALKAADPTYDEQTDENTYTIEEYGVFVEGTPKRWDVIKVTYHTVDKAFYMKPNKDYLLQMNVIDDHESGKAQVETVDEPTWNGAVVSDFENGYLTYNFPSNGYTVLKLTLNGNSAICSYDSENDDTPPCIFLQNGTIKYFDNVNTHDLFSPTQNNIYLKLPTDYTEDREIEYSYDGETFTSTGVTANFIGYDLFALGKGHINGTPSRFTGSIDLTESYYQNGNTKTYLFSYYKKIIPVIKDNEGTHYLTLEPLLTIKDTVRFAYGFNGQIFMEDSGLTVPDAKYWTAKEISIYKDGELRDKVIRDDVKVDSSLTKTSEIVKVNPADLYCYITGSPKIGDKVILTYNTWYLFREKNTEYNFKITYDGDMATISYGKKNGEEYILYITERQNFDVNTGYQFNGILSIKDSTRGGMILCDYNVFYTYTTKYKKHDAVDWDIWYEFILERRNLVYYRCGYELLGTHYLETSWYATPQIETPFIAFYNSDYIKPVGNLSFSEGRTGIVSGFSEDAYLQLVMEKLLDGYTVSFYIHTGNNTNQGICTWLSARNGYFHTPEPSEIDEYRIRPNYTYIVQYTLGGYGMTVGDVDAMPVYNLDHTLIRMFTEGAGRVTLRIMGYNVGENTYQPKKPKTHYLTIIPYNPERKEGQTGYYVETPAQANKFSVSYRKVENPYNHATEEGTDTWYPAELTKQVIDYFGKQLDVYAVKVPFGWENGESSNENIDYYMGDKIEFKVKSDITSYSNLIPYNSIMEMTKAKF